MEKLELLKANLKIRGFFKKEENYRMFPMNRNEQLDFCKAWLTEYFRDFESTVDDSIYLNHCDYDEIDRKIYSVAEVNEILKDKMVEEKEIEKVIEEARKA